MNHMKFIILNILMNTDLQKRKRKKTETELIVQEDYSATAKCRTQSLPYYKTHVECFLAFNNVTYLL